MKQGLAAGITGFTHLFNAMTPLNSREPGVVGAALASGWLVKRDSDRTDIITSLKTRE